MQIVKNIIKGSNSYSLPLLFETRLKSMQYCINAINSVEPHVTRDEYEYRLKLYRNM